MKIIIQNHQRGLRFCNGIPDHWLGAGHHRFWSFSQMNVTIYDLNKLVEPSTPELVAWVSPQDGSETEVPYRHVGLLYLDGRPEKVLLPGKYIVWHGRHDIRIDLVSTEPLRAEIPRAFWVLFPMTHLHLCEVKPYERMVLYEGGMLIGILNEGCYAHFAEARHFSSVLVNLQERELQIVSQEVMTADKVTLRLNFVVKYKVIDPLQWVQASDSPATSLYSAAQIAARRVISSVTLDHLLEERNNLGTQMAEIVGPQGRTLGAEISLLDIKDIVLPGEIKTLLNRVIEAEKQAIASNILRREETAATRSLANTAKMLENNPTLMRLKELEAMKEMAEKIEHISIVAGSDKLLGLVPKSLRRLLSPNKATQAAFNRRCQAR